MLQSVIVVIAVAVVGYAHLLLSARIGDCHCVPCNGRGRRGEERRRISLVADVLHFDIARSLRQAFANASCLALNLFHLPHSVTGIQRLWLLPHTRTDTLTHRHSIDSVSGGFAKTTGTAADTAIGPPPDGTEIAAIAGSVAGTLNSSAFLSYSFLTLLSFLNAAVVADSMCFDVHFFSFSFSFFFFFLHFFRKRFPRNESDATWSERSAASEPAHA